jgi:protein required for attachment to host cells
MAEAYDMSKHWVVVADNVKARVFSIDHEEGSLHPVDTLEHPEGFEQSQDIESDRPGRSFDIVGQGRHSMGTEVDPVEHEKIRFAKRVGEYLRAACNAGSCNRILLVAGPHQLGLLRKTLDLAPGIKVAELEKNLGPFDDRQVSEHLAEYLLLFQGSAITRKFNHNIRVNCSR